MRRLGRLSVAVLLICWAAMVAHAQSSTHDHSRASEEYFELNKKNEVKIPGRSFIGRTVLEKGRYELSHREADGLFVFSFTPILKKDMRGEPVVVETRRRAVRRDRVRSSLLYAHTDPEGYLILRIEVAGENADYFF